MAERRLQQARFKGQAKLHNNADMGSKQLQAHCRLKDDAQDMLKVAITQLNFSARAYDRILKVSRTIADLQAAKLSNRITSRKPFNTGQSIGSGGRSGSSTVRHTHRREAQDSTMLPRCGLAFLIDHCVSCDHSDSRALKL